MTAEYRSQVQEYDEAADGVATATDAASAGEVEAQAAADQRLNDATVPEKSGPNRDDTALRCPVAHASGTHSAELPGEADGRVRIPEQPTGRTDGAADVPVCRGIALRTYGVETRRDPYDIPHEEDRPRSTYYQLLQREGAVGKVLEPYLYRVTVTRDDYCERAQAQGSEEGDELDKGLVDRLGDADELRESDRAWQPAAILAYTHRELKTHPELLEAGGRVDWLGLGTSLLDRAAALGKSPIGEERRSLLAGAATAVLFSDNPDDRLDLVERTHERNLGGHMAKALNAFDISVVLGPYRNGDIRATGARDDRSIQSLGNFAEAFEATPEEVARYRQMVEGDVGEPVDAHVAMQNAIADYETAEGLLSDVHDERLEVASVSPNYVDTYRKDPTKAERFALQEVFVQEQMAALFPDGDTVPFREGLAAQREDIEHTDTALMSLLTSAEKHILAMSRPVMERFNVPKGPPTEEWSREQLAAWRYNELHARGNAYNGLARFADPSIHGETAQFTDDIYDSSNEGAALPIMVTEAVRNILELAGEYTATTGDEVTDEELRDLTQSNRRQLMKLAATNLDHFNASTMNGNYGSALYNAKRPAALDETIMVRKSDGKLGLAIRRQDGSLTPTGPLFKSETASSQAGARLACVALHVNVEGPGVEADARGRNKVNSIDLVSRLMIDEAHERGLFAKRLERVAA